MLRMMMMQMGQKPSQKKNQSNDDYDEQNMDQGMKGQRNNIKGIKAVINFCLNPFILVMIVLLNKITKCSVKIEMYL